MKFLSEKSLLSARQMGQTCFILTAAIQTKKRKCLLLYWLSNHKYRKKSLRHKTCLKIQSATTMLARNFNKTSAVVTRLFLTLGILMMTQLTQYHMICLMSRKLGAIPKLLHHSNKESLQKLI